MEPPTNNHRQLAAILLLALEVQSVVIRCTHADYRTDMTTPSGVVNTLAAICLVMVIYAEHTRGLRASALLSLYITLGIIIDGTRTRSYFLRGVHSLGGTSAAATSLRFVLLCFQEYPRTGQIIDPKARKAANKESTSGYWARTFFAFMGPIFWSGFRKILSVDDLGNLGAEFSSHHLFHVLSQHWGQKRKSKANSLFIACITSWKKAVVGIAVPRLCVTGFIFAQPFVMRHMVLSHRQELSGATKGGLVGATFLSYTGSAVAKAIAMHMQYRLITRIRGGLISQLADKTQRLKMSQAKKQAAITLISTDLDGIVTAFPSLIEIPFSFLETAIGMYFLTDFVHRASFFVFLPLAVATVSGHLYGKHISAALKSWNKVVETRMAKTSRVLAQLPGIKMLGLGPKTAEYVQYLRIQEITSSFKLRCIQSASISTTGFMDMVTPVIVVVGALFWKVFGKELASEVVFPALGIIALIQVPIQNLMKSYPQAMSMMGCFARIQDYLAQEEHQDPRVLLNETPREVTRKWPTKSGDATVSTKTVQSDASRAVYFDSVSLSPIGMEGPLLRDLTFSLTPGSVSALFGRTGSGKTSIVDSILGEAEIHDGVVYVDDKAIALCGQEVWLPNMTVGECIVGGSEYDIVWLRTVVTICKLLEDIDQFEGGLDFKIGSGGVKLSGGQRQRISLARAAYARTPTMLVDDGFNALDRVTAAAIIHDLFDKDVGLVREWGCTVLMTGYLPECMGIADQVLFLDEHGRMTCKSSESLDKDFMATIVDMLYEEKHIKIEDDAPESEAESQAESRSDSATESGPNNNAPASHRDSPEASTEPTSPPRVEAKASKEEHGPVGRQKGDAKLYWLWIDEIGRRKLSFWLSVVMTMCIAEGFPTIYMKWWVEHQPANRLYFVGYASLAAIGGLLGGPCVWLLMVKFGPSASIGLHNKLNNIVFRATIGYLGMTDSGNILNRYGIDMDLVSRHIPIGVYNNLYVGVTTLIQTGITFSGADYMSSVLPVLLVVIYFTQRCYLLTSRQLRHLEIENQAPLVTFFREMADGLPYVRGFGWQAVMFNRGIKLLNQSQNPFYLLLCAQQLLSLVLDLLSSSMATILAILTLYVDGISTESSSGLSFLVLIVLGRSFNRAITLWTALETALGSMSRLRLFFDFTPVERLGGSQPLPKNWPSRGHVEMNNVTARYQPEETEQRDIAPQQEGEQSQSGQQPAEPPKGSVLKSISLSIPPGQKVGIMGRTGSGKSSLLMTLLGFLNYKGSIVIDGIDISTVPLDELRAKVVTISQNQVALDGTVYDNLLPFEKIWIEKKGEESPGDVEEKNSMSAAEKREILRDTLEQLRIWEPLQAKKGLDTELSEAGYSHGEMQLFCIARAVVRRRINGGNLVLIDEATAGVDRGHERVVRDMLRRYFKGCTIIIVAHRQGSVSDTDVILNMAKGRVIRRQERAAGEIQ